MTTGLAYPLAVDEETGNLKIVSEADWVKSRMDSVLDTLPLENPLRPRYGTESPLFSNFSITAGKPADVELGRGLPREQRSGLTKE
jgi:hypothetical protein